MQKRVLSIILSAAILCSMLALAEGCTAEPEPIVHEPGAGEVGVYMATFNASELVAYSTDHNVLQKSIVGSRAETFGIEQIDTLILYDDGTFALEKVMRSTATVIGMPDPISLSFSFYGTYEMDGATVTLSKAQSAAGNVSWGSIGGYMDMVPEDGSYSSKNAPGILGYYVTPYFVEQAKNTGMTVTIDNDAGTFMFEDVEPTRGNEGPIKPDEGSVSGSDKIDTTPGLMSAPLVDDMSAYNLKNYFAQYDMIVGTCVKAAVLRAPYEDVLLDQFSSVTFENDLKPSSILSQSLSQRNGKLTVSFSSNTIELLNWCKENDMPLRGHTLIWYMSTPDWIFREGFKDNGAYVGREEMIQRMDDFIRSFFEALEAGGWSDVMYAIDVVNEAIVAPDHMRDLPWLDIIGEDYVWYAFYFARKYAPEHIRLVYNDFDIDAKADKVIEIAKSLVDENGKSLIDAIGHQGHYGAYSNIDSLVGVLKRISDETGLEIQVTELDVNISTKGTVDEMKVQGQFYYNFVRKMLELKETGVNMTGISLWGFTDAVSWMPDNYMHLYDRNMTAKYAYFGMHGDYEHAGFDLEVSNPELGGYDYLFTADGDETSYIQLNSDGSYVDTVTGTAIKGTYRTSDGKTFSLYPDDGGSYVELTISDNGSTATRRESAGGSVQLVKAE